MVLKWLGVFPVKHNWLVLNAGDNQLVEVEVEEVVVEVEVAVEAVVFVEGAVQGVGEVVLLGVVVSGEGGDHRAILCNVFHIGCSYFPLEIT